MLVHTNEDPKTEIRPKHRKQTFRGVPGDRDSSTDLSTSLCCEPFLSVVHLYDMLDFVEQDPYLSPGYACAVSPRWRT